MRVKYAICKITHVFLLLFYHIVGSLGCIPRVMIFAAQRGFINWVGGDQSDIVLVVSISKYGYGV